MSRPLPPYDHRQRPAERLLAYHRNRCAVCGSTPEPGRPAHSEDHDPHTGLTRGLRCHRCHRCHPQAERGRPLLGTATRPLVRRGSAGADSWIRTAGRTHGCSPGVTVDPMGGSREPDGSTMSHELPPR
ncbi:endonuclease domain-containing protein [Streptomyces sp. CBMA123]|uniref:endonuclease domain-containing protein n=1 Tax=Streptomyces sp. CBMA123 TaxID=1896313 RepID=UPI001661ECA1